MREGAITVPDDFDADAEQDEGREPHQYVGARLAQRSDGPFGKSVTHIYSRRDCDETGYRRGAQARDFGQWRPRALAADRDGYCNRSRANCDRHGEGIKRIGRYLRLVSSPVVGELIARLEKAPSGSSHDESAGAPHDRQSDTEEFKHIRTDQQGAEQEEEAIERHAKREGVALRVGTVASEAKENRRAADRIYDRKQSRIDEKKSVSNFVTGNHAINPCPKRRRGAPGEARSLALAVSHQPVRSHGGGRRRFRFLMPRPESS